ncbi:hypothetical protein CPB83DRAFT_856123 [Crepidotus variabilis]|uniref:Uncharacterized protein n=1 Tax=Crepidotus variabilis TaxID=179855 RepID=A0A9P6EEG3_9AGAR|nr:hypothetical protein CPB83DRAFT_856123 [Crepidotus variabilis]
MRDARLCTPRSPLSPLAFSSQTLGYGYRLSMHTFNIQALSSNQNDAQLFLSRSAVHYISLFVHRSGIIFIEMNEPSLFARPSRAFASTSTLVHIHRCLQVVDRLVYTTSWALLVPSSSIGSYAASSLCTACRFQGHDGGSKIAPSHATHSDVELFLLGNIGPIGVV